MVLLMVQKYQTTTRDGAKTLHIIDYQPQPVKADCSHQQYQPRFGENLGKFVELHPFEP